MSADRDCRKRGYKSKRSAEQKLSEIRRKRNRSRHYHGHHIEARVYQCPTCQQWHLTSDEVKYWP